jgi:hypothetical protein
MKTLLSFSWSQSRSTCGNLYKANSSKEKVKTAQFRYETVSELNTKKLGNSPSFPTHTHTTLSAKRFRKYIILTINIAAEFCLWTEQRQDGSYLLGLRLAETPEVPSTNCRQPSQLSDGPSNGPKRLAICELRISEIGPVAESGFLGRIDLPV